MAFIPDEQGGFVPDEPSTASKLLHHAIPGLRALGQGAEALQKGSEWFDRMAYRAGGAVTDQAAKVAPAEVAGALGYATNLGIQALPTIVGTGVGARVGSAPMEATGKFLMQSALKPPKAALETGKAQQAIQTMLDDGVNVSAGGALKLRQEIARLNNEIKQAIAASPATVDKNVVASELQNVLNKFAKQVNPQTDIKAIRQAWDEFLNHPLLAGKNNIPVQLAQEMKQGTYKALGSKSYGELQGASVESQKALARSLKDELAKAVPGIEKLNARESALINAETLIAARELMSKNREVMGIGAGGLGFMNPFTLVAWMSDRSPHIKSILARAAYSGRETIPGTAGGVIGGGIGYSQGAEE